MIKNYWYNYAYEEYCIVHTMYQKVKAPIGMKGKTTSELYKDLMKHLHCCAVKLNDWPLTGN